MRAAAILVAALLLAGLAGAQDKVRFDPSRDLEGFDKASLSEFADLYPLDTYLKMRDQEVTPEQLADLKKQWTTARANADQEIVAIRADPNELYVYTVRQKVRKHPYFSKIKVEIDRSVPGCVFFVQRPAIEGPQTEGPGYARRMADFYGKSMVAMQQSFEKVYVQPLGLARRQDFAMWAACILDTEDDYHAFTQTTEQMWKLSPTYYDPRLKLIVGYGDPYVPTTSPARQRFMILAEFVRAMEHAYFSGKGDRPASLWLNLGLASYLAWREAMVQDASSKGSVNRDLVVHVVEACQKKESRDIYLHPIADLLQVRETQDILLLAANRAKDLNQPEPDNDRALQLFYEQSTLWMHFLHEAQGGRYRDAFLKFFQSAMTGLGGLDALYLAFRGIDLAGLDRDFYRYLYGEYAKAYPTVKLDLKVVDDLFVDRAPKPKETAAETVVTPAAALPSTFSPFSPVAAAVEPKEFEGQHALALLQIVKGNLATALDTLENLAANHPEPPEDLRIAREIARVKQLILLRDGYFAYLKSSGQPLVGKYRGLDYIAKVDRVEGDSIYLGDNALGLSKIPLNAVEPYEIARQAGKREEQGAAEPWIRFYPYILVGDSKWELLFKELKDVSEGATQLREDAEAVYPDLLKTARAASTLNMISTIPDPKSTKETGRLFDAIKSLFTTYGDLPLVQRKTDVLKSIVSGVIMRTYVEQDAASLSHGTLTVLGNGLVNVVYDFNKAEEAIDFRRAPGYLPDFHASQQATVKKESESSWLVASGEFVGSGSASYRNFLDFVGPITVRYDVMFRNPPSMKPGAKPVFMFMVGVCDDSKGSYIGCFNFGSIVVADLESKYFNNVQDEKPAFAKKLYKVEIKADGENVTTFVNGEKKYASPVGGRKDGDVILWFHTDNIVAIQRLEIEGKIDPKWPEKAKAIYYQSKLAELGFK